METGETGDAPEESVSKHPVLSGLEGSTDAGKTSQAPKVNKCCY
jgi:hypothetical protein